MKKREVTEKIICDFCNEQTAWQKCLICGADICFDCQKNKAREYKHAIYTSGSRDGLYCHDCDAKARKMNDPLHSAYLVILALRNEYEGWCADFKKRSDKAEAELLRLQELRKRRTA